MKRMLCLAAMFCMWLPVQKAQGEEVDWHLGPFKRPAKAQPVIRPEKRSVFNCPINKTKVNWEALHTFNPGAVVKDNKVYVLYRAEDASGNKSLGSHTSRLGLAYSTDGLKFKKHPAPVLFPDADKQKDNEWPGGCEDPRVVEREDGTYVVLYTQWNRQIYRLAAAGSKDLLKWEKNGPVFADASGGKYADFTKSASIVTALRNGRLVAAKINGKYWMYWGEGTIRLAFSDDLLHWTPVEGKEGKLLDLLPPRAGRFDSILAEAGPPAVLTDKGIVLLYNGKNNWPTGGGGDPDLGIGVYSAGQALFDKADPSKLLARDDKYFFRPELPWEATGQYKDGTTFIEGLVFFKDRWFLYYGCADSRVGVAVWGPGK